MLRAPEWTCTGEDIFTKLKEEGLSSENCIGVCREKTGAMLGKERTESESLTSGAACTSHTLYYSQRISSKQNT